MHFKHNLIFFGKNVSLVHSIHSRLPQNQIVKTLMTVGFVPTVVEGEEGGLLTSWMQLVVSPITHFKERLVRSVVVSACSSVITRVQVVFVMAQYF